MDGLIKWLRDVLDLDEYLADGKMVKMGWSPARWYAGHKIPGTEQHLVMSQWTRADGQERHDPVAIAAGHGMVSTLALLASPHTVLARVAAHRALLDEHALDEDCFEDPEDPDGDLLWCRRCHDRSRHEQLKWPCPTVRILGAMYADRPGYREEWRP